SRDEAGRLITNSQSGGPTSVDMARTLAALRRCVALAFVVAVTAGLAGEERLRQRLLSAGALVGAAILFVALVVGAPPGYRILGLVDLAGSWKDYKNPLLSGFLSEGTGYADEVPVGEIHYVSNAAVVGGSLGAMVNANHFAACVGVTLP